MVPEENPRTVYWLDDRLYLNITNKCSNRCVFCFRNFKQGIGDFVLRLDREPTIEQVTTELGEASRRRTWKEIVFCGFGEPTERLDLLLQITRWVRSCVGTTIPIRVNTNGHCYLLNPGRDVERELKRAGVSKVSISLNAATEETYNEVCMPSYPGAFSAVLDFIDRTRNVLDVEVTAVTTPEVEITEVEGLARKLGVKFRLRPCISCFW